MADEVQVKQTKRKFRMSKTMGVMAVLCMVAVGASVFFYLQYQGAQNEKTANAKLIDRIGQVIQLPSETPLVVTVADKAKLSNKQLATKVNDGDVMIIYSTAKKLVVYRPADDRVTDMLSFASEADLLKQ